MSEQLVLAPDRVTVLDGGLATELLRRGLHIRAPFWTSEALSDEAGDHGHAIIEAIHLEYIEAGADIITANTFRTNPRTLAAAGVREPRTFTHLAVELARRARARARRHVWIAGSVAPVGESYDPSQAPPNDTLRADHREHIANLIDAGADLILAETMNSLREIAIIGELMAETAKAGNGPRKTATPWIASFVCDLTGRVLSGDAWVDIVNVLCEGPHPPMALAINCTLPQAAERALRSLRQLTSLPLGLYPNVELREGEAAEGHVDFCLPVRYSPAQYGGLMATIAKTHSLALVGGCCGTTPMHIRALVDGLSAGSSSALS